MKYVKCAISGVLQGFEDLEQQAEKELHLFFV
jgi:hypothetical protein